MVKITDLNNGTLAISGKTFDHREKLKQLGARWTGLTKSWVIANTPKNLLALKELTTTRRCGHCGELGHFKPKCPKHHEERRIALQKESEDLMRKPHYKFERYKASGFCKCHYESRKYSVFGDEFSVPMPKTCDACHFWCCGNAKPIDDDSWGFRYTCPHHGSSLDKFSKDSSGT